MLLAVMGESASSEDGVSTGLSSVKYFRLGLLFSLFAIIISSWSRSMSAQLVGSLIFFGDNSSAVDRSTGVLFG